MRKSETSGRQSCKKGHVQVGNIRKGHSLGEGRGTVKGHDVDVGREITY